MKIEIKKDPKFTVGISYQEHLAKVRGTFDSVVRPQLEDAAREATSVDSEAQTVVLTSAQKAYLNCLNPI